MTKLTIGRALEKAKSHANRGEYEVALALYNSILKAFPENRNAQKGLANLNKAQRATDEQAPLQTMVEQLLKLYNQGQLEVAIAQSVKLSVQYPTATAIWNILGAASAQLGKLDQAVQAFKQITTINPNEAVAYFNMGNALKDQGKLDDAIEAYKKALAIKPDYEAALNNVVVALKSLGVNGEKRADAVLKAYNQAQAIRTDSARSFFQVGLVHQQKGKLAEAIEAYNKALAIKPDYVEVYSNKGAALADQGKLKEAVKAYGKALAIKPDYAGAYFNLGGTLADQGKLEQAIEAYNKALTIKPDYAEAQFNIGATLVDQGKLEEALEACGKALAIKPDYAEAHFKMGNILKDAGKLEEAIEAYNKALTIKPEYAKSFFQVGLVHQQKGTLAEAIEAYNKALAIKPDYVEVYSNKGVALAGQGKLEEAIEAYGKALTIKPDYADACYNMGVTLREQGKLEEAIAAYRKAFAIKPDYAEAHYNMGNTLQEQGKLGEAIEAYDKALAIKPDYAEAYNNMGVVLQAQGKLEKAIEACNKALAIRPDYAEAHQSMGFALLTQKDFFRGFKRNEWRWKTKKGIKNYIKSTKPFWNGEKKQRVLVWGEQGIGDEVMFSSIIPELYAVSSQLLVQCDTRLIPLFERSFPTDIIYYPRGSCVPEERYDFHIPMGSLPLTFRKSLDSFKASSPEFLKCNMVRAEIIKSQLSYKPGKKLVGISWNTKSNLPNSSNRNINLADLASALDGFDIQLVCLQYGDVSDEIEALKTGFGIDVLHYGDVDNKNDIDGLASLIRACDMVVTIDNFTAHLSAALGVPTKLMLPYRADWRWGNSENRSYWYDALHLYRQRQVNDWTSALAKI